MKNGFIIDGPRISPKALQSIIQKALSYVRGVVIRHRLAGPVCFTCVCFDAVLCRVSQRNKRSNLGSDGASGKTPVSVLLSVRFGGGREPLQWSHTREERPRSENPTPHDDTFGAAVPYGERKCMARDKGSAIRSLEPRLCLHRFWQPVSR